jgi:hypothetical protein
MCKLADFWLRGINWRALPRWRHRNVQSASREFLAYWAVLVLAILGWSALRRTNEPVAVLLLIYATGFTLVHLPLVMNTCLRIPLPEPWFVILAGAGWMSLWQTWTSPWGLDDSAIEPDAGISIGPHALRVPDSR